MNSTFTGHNVVLSIGDESADGGLIEFVGSSFAGHATYVVNGCTHSYASGGILSFKDYSSADNATIIVNGARSVTARPEGLDG